MDCRCSAGRLSGESTKAGLPRGRTTCLGAVFSDEDRIYLGIVCPGTVLCNLGNYSFEPQKRELEVKMILSSTCF